MVELLAPAGDYKALEAALSAGADAIYLAGEKYGARAYAKNFSQDELIDALNLVHLHGKKLYMTINTLLSQKELEELPAYLKPYYEAGLDGVIVQDLGAALSMRQNFPDLELHASTQMTLTGPCGPELLKEYGFTRVVPARELSLEEIKRIKKETGLEIETFIHGAMCYCYSGQCLYSSMLGPRSGNRGRCAGPCRLAFSAILDGKKVNNDKEQYQLSLKDLCTLEILPQLLDAGIDSFKIEGRMKSPEYVYYVTSLYRKYIDMWLESPKDYRVSQTDIKALQSNFSRGSVESGYYFKHNGRSLVTLEKPGYQSFDVEEDAKLQVDVKPLPKIEVTGYFRASTYEPMNLTLCADNYCVSISGDVASMAQKNPAKIEDVYKQLNKTGNTPFAFRELQIDIEGDVFLPNKSLNELRRTAIIALQKEMLAAFIRNIDDSNIDKTTLVSDTNNDIEKNDMENKDLKHNSFEAKKISENREILSEKQKPFHIRFQTFWQFQSFAVNSEVSRIYISFDCFLSLFHNERYLQDFTTRVEEWKKNQTQVYLDLPAVTRQVVLKQYDKYLQTDVYRMFDGCLINNLETLGYFQKKHSVVKCTTDSRLHIFQKETLSFYDKLDVNEHVLGFELHKSQIMDLLKNTKEHAFILPVFGRVPVMESAGCICKTNQKCQKELKDKRKPVEEVVLMDRQRKTLPVVLHCERCENTIYNTVPLSLHKEMEQICKLPLSGLLLSFVTENANEMNAVYSYYRQLWKGKGIAENCPIKEFTKGHFVKSVE